MKTAIYVRVSTLEQAEEGYSIDEQIAKLKAYCDIKDWNIYDVYVDGGYSGSNINRPGIKKLVTDAEKGVFNSILVYKLDRLSRSQKDTLYLIEDVFAANDIGFVSLNENFDTNTPFGKAMIGILAVFAQLEREQIKERMTMGKIGRAKSGKAMSWSIVPFGYKYENDEYIVHPLQASIVKDIFEKYLKGMSITKLKYYLNEAGHLEKNVPWSYKTIRQVLENPVYAGYTKYKDQLFEGNHLPVITKGQFEETQRQIEIRQKKAYEKNNNPRPFQSKYMASGLIRCGYCDSSMGLLTNKPKKDGTKSSRYKCYSTVSSKKSPSMKKKTSCIATYHQREDVEKAVLNELQKLKMSPKRIRNKQKKDNSELYKSQLQEIDSKIEKIVNLYIDNAIPLNVLDERKNKLLEQKNKIENKIKNDNKEKMQLDYDDAIDILNSYDDIFDLDYEEKTAIVKSILHKIVVYNDKYEFMWKFEVS